MTMAAMVTLITTVTNAATADAAVIVHRCERVAA